MTATTLLIRRTRKGPPCSVGLLLSLLDPDEAEALEGWLRGPMESVEIAERVMSEGYADIAGTTFARHRRGICLCGRVGA
jgi:hypothetical protein